MAKKATRSKDDYEKQFGNRRLSTSWLRHAVRELVGVVLRVLIYARFSTEEQNVHSIDAQVSYCKRFLTSLGIENYSIEVLSDEAISGEKIWRPGIDKVREGIASKRWDLILAEESSRLMRNPQACIELAHSAVARGIRTICVNDYVDTADEDRWEENLYEAQRHHAQANKFTIRRIIRDQEERWESSAAMGPLRAGYRRTPTRPATQHEPEEGPFFDAVDERWSPIIYQAFERIAAEQPTWMVGQFLRGSRLPGVNGAQKCDWTERQVVSLIQCERYRGVEVFRKYVSRKNSSTGEREQKRATRDEMWTREMPHLRIVPDWLWYKANDTIADRTRGKNRRQGDEHPLTGIPRDSRGPLSGVLFCGCPGCGKKLHQNGRLEGGYCCSVAKKGECWNKATATRADVHANLSTAICETLAALGHADFLAIVDGLNRIFLEDINVEDHKLAELTAHEKQLDDACDSLARGVEYAKETQDAPKRLVDLLITREGELARVRAEITRLKDPNGRITLPTITDLQIARDELVAEIARMDRMTGAALQRLVGKMFAIPFQQFGTNKVVLRAKFELNLQALLSPALTLRLATCRSEAVASVFHAIPMVVDLFTPSFSPKFGLVAMALRDRGLSLREIAQQLSSDSNATKRTIHLAIQYGEQMRAAGLTDAFIELTEPPRAASRWRTHAKFKNADENAEKAVA